MLDNLVESRNNNQNTRRGGFMFTTAVLVFSLFASGILWSLFAKDLGLSGEGLELSALVAPPAIPENEPPKPEPIKETKQTQTQKTEDNVIIRKENMASTDEPIAPKDISTTPNTSLSRPKNADFRIGAEDVTPSGNTNGTERTGRNGGGTGDVGGIPNQGVKSDDDKDNEPPVIKKKEETKVETKQKGPIQVSSILNGKATSLPKPVYSAAAKAVRASGDVNVQVTIDERGNVVSASAVSGHALLKATAEQAARSAKFTPTLLNGQPVKVTGIIVYKFAMQ